MSAIQIILFKQSGKLHCENETIDIDANQLVVTDENSSASAFSRDCWLNVYCYPGDLHELYHEVIDLIGSEDCHQYHLGTSKIIPINEQLIDVVEQLSCNKNVLMKFLFIYCLSMDNKFFSRLLRYFLAHNDEVLSYLEGHFMKPWSVSKYAENLNVDVRKLNFLFYRNYGKSAKRWLIERRLSYARKQLVMTSKKVADIALESGFSNQAHFADAFKKQYLCSPTVLRSTVT